ncbi:MAG: formate dehydrogenase accessory sulfurtransferase FdhD [Desulfosarcina sp.]|nr:formate dehydrogenase accessory sulfurtransferase FdhD [Desulfobacterales bacterium]
MKNFLEKKIIYWNTNSNIPTINNIIIEEPLSIRVNGIPYSVILRTPGDEVEHAAGFCLAKGLVDTPDDFISISFCEDNDNTNLVDVAIREKKKSLISNILEQSPSVDQTSVDQTSIEQTNCEFCGNRKVLINKAKALSCLEDLSKYQPLRVKTRACHAAALCNEDFEFLSVAEDVGRHNALDKAVGKLFLKKMLDDAAILILSSRISYELVQKAARAKISVILAVSRPTSLAVQLALRLNITLACFAPGSGLYIFTHEYRLRARPKIT